jgi:predicted ATPase
MSLFGDNILAIACAASIPSILYYYARRNTSYVDHEEVLKASTATNKVYKFVLTGGPSGGKTTALDRIQTFLRERGFRCFIIPEAATLAWLSGCSVDDFGIPNTDCARKFQEYVISTQITLEDEIYKYAVSTGQSSVIICDRGLMDGSAYVSREVFAEILLYAGLNIVQARDNRYDAVLHLVTAAIGAESFYSNETNSTRLETMEEAAALDIKLQAAWSGHPHHAIIDNSNGKSFEKKLEQLISTLSSYVGLPSLTKRSKKFLIEPLDLDQLKALGVMYEMFVVEKIILKNSFRYDHASPQGSKSTHQYSFLRKRSQGKLHSYGLTSVAKLDSDGTKVELKKIIDRRMYQALANTQACEDRYILRQNRYCFLWEHQSFTVIEQTFPNPLWILQIQCEGEPRMLSALKVVKTIGESESYSFSSYHLALRSSSPSFSTSGDSPYVTVRKIKTDETLVF